ncbi:unnamed protein product [Brachionus calyciflorus]|uniref:HAUS augmin-like complex subunit 3 N-terminal domain-containing protein n=1 Tax=Brachionus calyciflorus TaxID=104777 RepID=A0A813WRY2_9BILA|nr:unnamed protein product [Brachionus calyciflorus]
MEQNKSDKLYSLLKHWNFPDIATINPNSLDYLFDIPDTRPFFDWFFANVTESCYIPKSKLEAFDVKASKGQVIYDLDKLEEMNRLMNLKRDNQEIKTKNLREILNNSECRDELESYEFDFEKCNDIELLKKEIEKTEKEVQFQKRKHEFNKFCQKKFNDDLKETKIREESESRLQAKLEEKENYLKNSSKMINQNLNKTFIEFQAKLSDEERLNCLISNEEEIGEIDNYIVKEKAFLNTIKNLMNLELDCTDLKNLKGKLESDKIDSKEPTEKELLNQKQFQIIMKKKFPKAMDEWIHSKVGSKSSKTLLDEINRIDAEFDQFFVYSEDQLKQDPNLVAQIEQQILQNEQAKEEFLEKYKNLVKLMPTLINQLAYLKMVHLACIDLEKKELDLNLFYNKQDKLFKALNSQKSRIEFINYLQNSKLNNLENLKELFDELIDDHNQNGNKTNAHNSMASTSILATPMISMLQQNKNMNLSNFNQFSNANMLSSTMCSQFISSPSKQLSSKYSHSLESHVDPNTGFIHILNQFLITALRKFDQSDDLSGDMFKLTNPISINFNDNLDNYINLKNSINNLSKSSSNLIVLEKQCKYFFNGILKAIEYLYERDETTNESNSRLKNTMNYNLSKINVKMTKKLEMPIKKLGEQCVDLQNLFAAKIFQNYNQLKHYYSTDKLANIQRNFFVYFYTNPKQIEVIMEQLNSIS